ncbi:hypothetical protein VP01_1629g2 [Puccinia sorghi]|uniref:Uncharacterized protein n=1 Tax=Puccinia sorghi TaxID=27349 RepID=A0A0L6VGV1_9BASI|nr:hypothetical protein VP01_1629g2 [Puccinia sorghi]
MYHPSSCCASSYQHILYPVAVYLVYSLPQVVASVTFRFHSLVHLNIINQARMEESNKMWNENLVHRKCVDIPACRDERHKISAGPIMGMAPWIYQIEMNDLRIFCNVYTWVVPLVCCSTGVVEADSMNEIEEGGIHMFTMHLLKPVRGPLAHVCILIPDRPTACTAAHTGMENNVAGCWAVSREVMDGGHGWNKKIERNQIRLSSSQNPKQRIFDFAADLLGLSSQPQSFSELLYLYCNGFWGVKNNCLYFFFDENYLNRKKLFVDFLHGCRMGLQFPLKIFGLFVLIFCLLRNGKCLIWMIPPHPLDLAVNTVLQTICGDWFKSALKGLKFFNIDFYPSIAFKNISGLNECTKLFIDRYSRVSKSLHISNYSTVSPSILRNHEILFQKWNSHVILNRVTHWAYPQILLLNKYIRYLKSYLYNESGGFSRISIIVQ